MADAAIIAAIKRAEGWPRYTNHPDDLGGATKGGITLDTLRAWRKNPALGLGALQALEESEADAIYQFQYLQPFAAIPDPALRHYLIDLGVLRGPRRAAMMLQDILGVESDGWIGPKTLTALADFKAPQVLVMLIGARFIHIADRVRQNPSQQTFAKGWRHRNRTFLP